MKARQLLHIPALALVLAVILPGGLAAQAQKRLITESDLFAFTWIGDTQISQDGSRAVFVQTAVNAKRTGYETSLYLLNLDDRTATPRRLTAGPHDSSPRWSPDGSQLAFLRATEKEGKPQPPQLYLLPLNGGEATAVSALEEGVSNPAWSPDGGSIAVLSDTLVKPEKKPDEKEEKKGEKRAEAGKTGEGKTDEGKTDEGAHKSDVRIITKAVYRMNGAGYIDLKSVEQLYVYAVGQSTTAAQPRQLTEGPYAVDEFVWAPQSGRILYTSQHSEEPSDALPFSEIYAVAVGKGEKQAEKQVGQADGSGGGAVPASSLLIKLDIQANGLAVSPDGRHLAFRSEAQPDPPRSHQQTDLFVLDLSSDLAAPVSKGGLHNLTERYDYEIGSGVGGDNTAPRGAGKPKPTWTEDGSSLLDIVGKEGSALLVAVNASTGEVKELSAPRQAVLTFALSKKGAAPKLLALISTPVNIGDLFSLALDGSLGQAQLTHVNEALFSQLKLTLPEAMEVAPTARAGDIANHAIESFVQRPPEFDAKKKYPLILNIHGGPHAAYGWVFDHEMQWLAARGYIVVYPNPRGSTTYGQQFANVIQHNYPGDDYHDLMDSVDAAIKAGSVDTNRLGVTGGSGGGLLTDWTVTQTNRFRAAVAQRDITDWANWWYTADFTLFQPTWFEGPPFEHPEEFRKYSPLTYVKNVQTPMMFILGEADYRTPTTSGGEDFYRALKYRHIDTVMVRFPNESHELSRSGQPWHRVERLENIVNWFDKYLKDVPQPQYQGGR